MPRADSSDYMIYQEHRVLALTLRAHQMNLATSNSVT